MSRMAVSAADDGVLGKSRTPTDGASGLLHRSWATRTALPPVRRWSRPQQLSVAALVTLGLMIAATTVLLVTYLREQTSYLIAASVLLEMVVIGIGLLMLRQVHDQRMLSEARAARAEAEAELAVALEKDRTSHALRTQNELFGVALSNMSQALGMFDASDSLIVANRRLAEIFAIPQASIRPGMTIDMLRALAISESNLAPSDVTSM